jgi:hypothetical protein
LTRWTRDLSWSLLKTSRLSPIWIWRAPTITGADTQVSSSWCTTSSPGELCRRMVMKPQSQREANPTLSPQCENYG